MPQFHDYIALQSLCYGNNCYFKFPGLDYPEALHKIAICGGHQI